LFRRLSKINGGKSAEFGRYFVRKYAQALSREEALSILAEMEQDANIEFAYFEPKVINAVVLERMQKQQSATQNEYFSETRPEDYESQQFYLNPAPEGVDARYSWQIPGGTGKGIRVVDVETGWDTDHFEFGGVFFDNGKNARNDHGTSVWGEVGARRDGTGITGIAYDVEWGIAGSGFSGNNMNEYPPTIAAVIEDAVMQMKAGDVLIIEQHAPLVDDFGPIEYFEPVFKVLRMATQRGIHCVAAAGNGYSDLDHSKYNGAFDLTKRDSGCIMVGAADSIRGSRARYRSDFSNYGSRVDAFGYGEDVVTSGYGDLFDGKYQNRNVTYTRGFSGTSSATPIVSGVVVNILGIAKVKGVTITPAELREALRKTGSSQEGPEKGIANIGTLPDLKQLTEYFNLN
jgi:subtilisin family serine protease